jgi:hypothetical protein
MSAAPVPPVPSREAVEEMLPYKLLPYNARNKDVEKMQDMLRTLLAEVERLTGVEGDAITGAIAWAYERDALKRTVYEQGAALDRLRDELSNIATVDPMGWIDFERGDRLNQFRQWAQNRARHALASAQS